MRYYLSSGRIDKQAQQIRPGVMTNSINHRLCKIDILEVDDSGDNALFASLKCFS